MPSVSSFDEAVRIFKEQEATAKKLFETQMMNVEKILFKHAMNQILSGMGASRSNPQHNPPHSPPHNPFATGRPTMRPHTGPKRRRQSPVAPGQRIARIYNIDNEKFLKLETPYIEAFIKDFKSSIHHTKRSYMGTENYWIITYDQLKFLITLCKKHFDDTLLFGFPQNIIDGGDCFAVLYLLPTAPLEVVRASYRSLANIYHPDKPGGSSDGMSRINTAYRECLEKIKERKVNWDKL